MSCKYIILFIIELYLSNLHYSVHKMVRNKPRKTQTHGQTDPKQMEEAVKLVLDGKWIRKVSQERGISKSTLQKYVAKTKSVEQHVGLSFRLYALLYFVFVYV